jgi:hypothetical protein
VAPPGAGVSADPAITSVALRLVADAAELAAVAGVPRYVAPMVDPKTGEATLQIVEDEPVVHHVRVSPSGECVVVFLPVENPIEP